MVRYLSDEWMERAATALAEHPPLGGEAADVDLTVAYEVTGSADGKRVYALRLSDGRLSLEEGPHPDAQVSFALDYDTAAAISRGELSAQAAFMQGRLKLGGDVMVLVRDAGALDALGDALGGLRSDTDY